MQQGLLLPMALHCGFRTSCLHLGDIPDEALNADRHAYLMVTPSWLTYQPGWQASTGTSAAACDKCDLSACHYVTYRVPGTGTMQGRT